MPTTPAQQAHYQRNKARYIAQAKEQRRALLARVTAIKEETPCADCGRKFPAVCMDFDHIDHQTKVANVAALIQLGSWPKIEAEIGKCTLVCACCHRIRTHRHVKDGGTYIKK